MESQTITLILGAIVVLIIVNYLFLDDNGNVNNGSNSNNNGRRRRNIIVTNEMIESVRSIAPGLTTGQIRADLIESGSVQSTVERYLSGALVAEDHNDNNTASASGTAKLTEENGTGVKGVNGKSNVKHGDGPFGGLTFDEKKQAMILENIKKLSEKRGCDYVAI